MQDFRINFDLIFYHRTAITGPQIQPEMVSKCMYISSFMVRKLLDTALFPPVAMQLSLSEGFCVYFISPDTKHPVHHSANQLLSTVQGMMANYNIGPRNALQPFRKNGTDALF